MTVSLSFPVVLCLVLPVIASPASPAMVSPESPVMMRSLAMASPTMELLSFPVMVSARRSRVQTWHQTRKTAVPHHLKRIRTGGKVTRRTVSSVDDGDKNNAFQAEVRQTGDVLHSSADSTSRVEMYMPLTQSAGLAWRQATQTHPTNRGEQRSHQAPALRGY